MRSQQRGDEVLRYGHPSIRRGVKEHAYPGRGVVRQRNNVEDINMRIRKPFAGGCLLSSCTLLSNSGPTL